MKRLFSILVLFSVFTTSNLLSSDYIYKNEGDRIFFEDENSLFVQEKEGEYGISKRSDDQRIKIISKSYCEEQILFILSSWPHPKQIKQIYIAIMDSTRLTEETLAYLSEQFPSLESIYIDGGLKIDETRLLEMEINFPNLKFFRLTFECRLNEKPLSDEAFHFIFQGIHCAGELFFLFNNTSE